MADRHNILQYAPTRRPPDRYSGSAPMAPKGFTRVSLDYHHSSPHRSVRCLPKIRAMTSILKRVWHLRNCSRKRACVFVALAALSLMVASPAAFAHVKWFCNYNVAEQPVLLPQVISGGFGQLVALALLFLLALAIRNV